MNPAVHFACHAATGAALVLAGVALAWRERVAAGLFGISALAFCTCLHEQHHRR